ncbi:MAG: M23 family metallopeptidase [Bauldia sp.]
MPPRTRTTLALGCLAAVAFSFPALAQDAAAPTEVAAVQANAAPAAVGPIRAAWRARAAAAAAAAGPLLTLPLAGQLTSDFGYRRHPVSGGNRFHEGVDLSAPSGTPILAAGTGVVTFAGWDGDYGNVVRIAHQDGVETTYAHQSGIAAGIAVGVTVVQGQVIGAVGSTGLATGPHLHFEVRINGEAIDPFGPGIQQAHTSSGTLLAQF